MKLSYLMTGLLMAAAVISAADLNSNDTDFMKKAAKGGMAEVELGRMAARKGASAQVRDFGSRMIRDHSKADRELMALAAAKGVELPKSISLGEDVSVAHLKMLSGKSFDEAYVKMMVDDHKDDVAAFQKEADQAQDPDVKRFVEKTLPTLQSHLDKIQAIQSEVSGQGSSQ
jgi:putative membrane protein